MPCLRAVIRLAQEMDELLGRSSLLFGAQSPESIRISRETDFEMTDSPYLPSTRSEALARLDDFLPDVPRYANQRNEVVPGNTNLSRLSPATRTRLILEREICETVAKAHPPAAREKFEQEVWWRLYWKGWLEQRPSVWKDYRTDLQHIRWTDRAREVAAGESGVAIMDHFAKELIADGYLANHARMWWASFWIHVEDLPWQLGADFFLRHLRDGDAASNTLSWRWVAGIHTHGKAYLVRRSNLEKYVEPELLRANSVGMEKLEATAEKTHEFVPHPSPEPISFPAGTPVSGRIGIWMHDEDLLPEDSPLQELAPASVCAPSPVGIWNRESYSPEKQQFLKTALQDGCRRAGKHFGLTVEQSDSEQLIPFLTDWAVRNSLSAVITMRPFVGPLTEIWQDLETSLSGENIELIGLRRADDIAAMNPATAGFFGFWKKTKPLRGN